MASIYRTSREKDVTHFHSVRSHLAASSTKLVSNDVLACSCLTTCCCRRDLSDQQLTGTMPTILGDLTKLTKFGVPILWCTLTVACNSFDAFAGC